MKGSRRLLARPLPLTLVVLLGLTGCEGSSPRASAAASPREARLVRLVAAESRLWPQELRVTGESLASETALLAAQVPGQLVAWHVERGDRVESGQLLAEIDPRDYGLRVERERASHEALLAELGQARQAGESSEIRPQIAVDETPLVREALANYRQAQLDRERAESLRKDGITSIGELDSARLTEDNAQSRLAGARDTVLVRIARLEQQRVALALAESDLARAQVAAPFAGAVAERSAGLGDTLAVGSPLVVLVRFDPLRVRLIVPEQDVSRVALGQPVTLTLDSAGGELRSATLARLAPALDAANRTLWAEVELANPDGQLKPGSFVRASVITGAELRSMVIPESALVRFAGTDRAFSIEAGHAVEHRLTLGRDRLRGDGVRELEVLAGLEPGTRVIENPGSLVAGEAVAVHADEGAEAEQNADQPTSPGESAGGSKTAGSTSAAAQVQSGG